MVFKATFNNISVISWRAVLLVEKTTNLSQVTDKLYHIMSGNIWQHCISGTLHKIWTWTAFVNSTGFFPLSVLQFVCCYFCLSAIKIRLRTIAVFEPYLYIQGQVSQLYKFMVIFYNLLYFLKCLWH